MKIAMIGTGYVGLVTGTCFAESGNDVICVDTDEKKIAGLRNGIIPIYEPGLDGLVKRNVGEERLSFTTSLEDAVAKSLLLFIAVGTPPGEDGSADLRHVLAVARGIGRSMKEYRVIVDKSTVPVGTGEKVKAAIREELAARGENIPFDVVSNPEFLKEGNAIDDFMKPDRVVIGCEDVRTGEQHSYQLEILEAVEAVNYRQKKVLFNKLVRRYGENLTGKTIAVWGLAFKPNTDDMREAPSIVLIENLLAAGATVRAYDPEAMKEAHKSFGDRITYGKKAYDVLEGADALVIVTEWNEFRHPDLERVKTLLKTPVIVDGRNLFEPKKMLQQGFDYEGIGRRL